MVMSPDKKKSFYLLQYSPYQVRSCSSGKPLKFRLCDTRGLEETQGIDANDVSFLLDGNVPDGYLVGLPNLARSTDYMYLI